MESSLLNHNQLYGALIAGNQAFEGIAFVAVTTTGIFCRLTCPARKPKRENTIFLATAAECLRAGYRPCKRCRPTATARDLDPIVSELLSALDDDPGRKWSEGHLAGCGFEPSTVRRAFQRQFGVTFLEMARKSRLHKGVIEMSRGSRVIDAQLEAGFDSASGFREAFAKFLGRSPSAATDRLDLRADWIPSPLGPMIAVADDSTLHLLEFFDRRALPGELKRLESRSKKAVGIGSSPAIEQIRTELADYFAGQSTIFQTPLALAGSAFSRRVWSELQRIPIGATRSYAAIAKAIGRPTAVRAVANANGYNGIAIVIPCHRVIGSDGSLTGYGGGIWRKRWLIEHEQEMVSA